MSDDNGRHLFQHHSNALIIEALRMLLIIVLLVWFASSLNSRISTVERVAREDRSRIDKLEKGQ